MEILFKRDTAFRKQFFVPDSFAHPAKMDAQLLIWLVEHYSHPGETILDPMAGSGTLMLACGLGRNVILLELEHKFVLMMKGGDCDGFQCAKCSLREEWKRINNEDDFLELADKYFPKNKQLKSAFLNYGWEWTRDQILKRYPVGAHHITGNWALVKQKPQFAVLGSVMGECLILQGDARNLSGILADKIISSPPYSEGLGHQHRRYGRDIEVSKSIQAPEYSQNENNLGNLPYGSIDKVITSPPYSERMDGGMKDAPSMLYTDEQKNAWFTTRDQRNIGNLRHGDIDSIITSPPYEESVSVKQGGERETHQEKRAARLQQAGYNPKDYQGGKGRNLQQDWVYSNDDTNIGNLKGETYLSAMLQVYKECHKVLKPAGLLVLVTKDFIRNKKRIDLAGDTVKLCERAGFRFIERHYRKLPAQSFWRTIYYKKHPGVEVIDKEDILVFER